MELANKHHLGRKLRRSWLVSYLSASTGFRVAAFQLCHLTVNRAIPQTAHSHFRRRHAYIPEFRHCSSFLLHLTFI